jgi:S-adenosyl-L-methionine hydrolase (adenosine-forming)
VQLGSLSGGKIADQTGLDPPLPCRLGEQQQPALAVLAAILTLGRHAGILPDGPFRARNAILPTETAMAPPLLTLLTDFGLDDYYVAAVKGTVLRLAPGTQLVDISHQIEPGNIAAASFLLAAAAPAFPDGTVHLAVVDPGVGSQRRILVAESAAGLLVAPDNGLLTPLLPGARVRSVECADLFLAAPGATFHGRDRFAPVAAFLLRGGSPGDLGPEIADPVHLARTPPRREPGLLSGVVVHIDRFGNLITDIPAAWLPAALTGEATATARTTHILARVGSHTAAQLADHYEQIPRYGVAVMIGSLGTLELAMRGEDLASRWGVDPGAAVQVRWRDTMTGPRGRELPGEAKERVE